MSEIEDKFPQKILLMGWSFSGKTSMRAIIFGNTPKIKADYE